MKNGKANIEGMGQIGDLFGKLGQAFWPVLKPAVERGVFDFKRFDTVAKMREALSKVFLEQEENCATKLGLNIGKVSKEELSKLSVWDLKNLQELFYQQVFGLNVSFPDELMPDATDEFAWPVCIPGIISNEAAYRSGKSDMLKWKYADKPLDSIMKLDRGRDAWIHSYIVRVRPNWEADEDFKNISGSSIDEKNINVLMFRERWILGLFIYWLTGQYLDHSTVTMTGSRNYDGNVVNVNWSSDRVNVNYYNPDNANDNLRFRQEVSKENPTYLLVGFSFE